MDHRDEVDSYGTFLGSLPEVSIDLEGMTATFYVERDLPPPPPPPLLEKIGLRVDKKLASLATKVTVAMHEKGLFRAKGEDYSRSDFHRWIPEYPRTPGTGIYAESLRHMLKLALEERSLYRLVRLQVNVNQKGKSFRTGEQQPNCVQLNLVLGARSRFVPGMEFWVSFSGRTHEDIASDNHWYSVLPLQFGTGKSPCPRY